MPQEDTISVVIPVYNRRDLVGRAIASALAQTHPALEIIVVDDGSEEDIASVVEDVSDARVRLIRNSTNQGAAGARNRGVMAARGSYVAFLDSDDEWMPRKLEVQLPALAASHPSFKATVSGYVMADASSGANREVRLAAGYDIETDCVWGCRIALGSTLLAARESFETVGLFDENLRRLEDWDWIIRFAEIHRMLAQPAPLAIVHHQRRDWHGAVIPALAYLDEKHRQRFAAISGTGARKFRSSLAIEYASMEYHRGRPLAAARNALRAMALYPFRDSAFLLAAARNGLSDVLHRFAPGR